MRLRVTGCLLLSIFAALSASRDARALVIVHDQFLQVGELGGKLPSPGPGSLWNPGAQGGVNPVMVVNTVALPVINEVALIQTEATNGEDIANQFADRTASATTYARFDFRLPAADNTTFATDADIMTEGLWFVTLRGTSASASLRARAGVVLPSGSGDFRLAISADNGNLVTNGTVFPASLSFDTTYRAVISFDASSATSKLWLDPVDESSTNVAHIGAGTSVGTIINRVSLRQHNSYNGKEFVDNVVVATTFADALNPPPPSLPGDYNGNGVVDGADYVLWRNGGPLFNEVDTPGTVNDADYTEWRARFGNTSRVGSVASGFATVPEPATALLVLCFSLLGTVGRRARRIDG